jgi:hypothetical protein
MAEKPKKDDSIANFKKWYDKANKIAETTKLAHSEAYIKAANKLLLDGEGNVDLEKLKDEDMQKQFTDEMYGHLFGKAQKHFKSGIAKSDPLTADRLMQAYTNTTYKQLHDLVKTHNKKYDINLHERVRDNLVNKLRDELTTSAAGHLGEKHKEGLVKAMEGSNVIDYSKAKIDDLVDLYGLYKERGNLTRESVLEYGRSKNEVPAYLKSPPKKK